MKFSIFAIGLIFVILLFPPVLNNKAFAAEGDISDAVIDTLNLDSTDVDVPKLFKVDHNTFAVVHEGNGNALTVQTFDVSSDGQITDTGTSETVTLDASAGGIPSVATVDSDTFVVAYSDTDSGADGTDGTAITFDIDSTGNIDTANSDTQIFDTVSTLFQVIIPVGVNNDFAVAYKGPDGDGFIEILDITATGAITVADEGEEYLDADTVNENEIIMVDTDTILIGILNAADNGQFKTIDVTNGDLADGGVTDTVQFNGASPDDFSRIIQVDSDTYAIAFDPDGSTISIVTMDVSSTGDISAAITDTLTIDEGDDADWAELVKVDSDTYAALVVDPGSRVLVNTFSIDSAGNIGDATLDSLEVVSGNVDNLPDIIAVDDDTFIVVYSVGGTGTIASFDIVNEIFTDPEGGGKFSCLDCEPPTLGLDNNFIRKVDYGFSYNNNPVQVERFFTPYPLITVDIGKLNVAELKIYENKGPDKLRHAALAFGLAESQVIGESEAVITWKQDFKGGEIVSLDDPQNAIEDNSIRVESSLVNCLEGQIAEDCVLLKIYHKFRAPLEFDIVGTYVWDEHRQGWQNFFNHGIHIVGESLNPEDGILVNDGAIRLYPVSGLDDEKFLKDDKNHLWIKFTDDTWKKLTNHHSYYFNPEHMIITLPDGKQLEVIKHGSEYTVNADSEYVWIKLADGTTKKLLNPEAIDNNPKHMQIKLPNEKILDVVKQDSGYKIVENNAFVKIFERQSKFWDSYQKGHELVAQQSLAKLLEENGILKWQKFDEELFTIPDSRPAKYDNRMDVLSEEMKRQELQASEIAKKLVDYKYNYWEYSPRENPDN